MKAIRRNAVSYVLLLSCVALAWEGTGWAFWNTQPGVPWWRGFLIGAALGIASNIRWAEGKRRKLVAEILADHDRSERAHHALHAAAERVVRSHCGPIPCDIKDNYVCVAHRHA